MESKWLIHTGLLAVEQPTPAVAACGVQLGAAVLAPPGAGDLAAELLGDELGAVADAEHRHAELVDAGVDDGRARRRAPTSGRR